MPSHPPAPTAPQSTHARACRRGLPAAAAGCRALYCTQARHPSICRPKHARSSVSLLHPRAFACMHPTSSTTGAFDGGRASTTPAVGCQACAARPCACPVYLPPFQPTAVHLMPPLHYSVWALPAFFGFIYPLVALQIMHLVSKLSRRKAHTHSCPASRRARALPRNLHAPLASNGHSLPTPKRDQPTA